MARGQHRGHTGAAAAHHEDGDDDEERGEDGGQDLDEGVVLLDPGLLRVHPPRPPALQLPGLARHQLLLDGVHIHHAGGRVPGRAGNS